MARGLTPRIPCREVVNGVDVKLFDRTLPRLERRAGERVILAARRMVPKNGVEYLVRAMPLIVRELPVHLYLVGDGPLRPALEALSRELGVGDRVSFLGGVPNDQMPGCYSSADGQAGGRE